MATDPVCGMTVSVTPGTPIAEHRDVVYSFCAEVCRRRFEKDPDRFLRPGAAPRRHPPASAARARQLGRLLRRLTRQLADPVDGGEAVQGHVRPTYGIVGAVGAGMIGVGTIPPRSSCAWPVPGHAARAANAPATLMTFLRRLDPACVMLNLLPS